MIPGIEIDAGVVRRSKFTPKPVHIPLSPAESRFLLYRLKDRSATAEAIVHHPPQGKHLSPWDRHQVIDRLDRMIDALRRCSGLFVITPLDRALIVEAIEHNPYFANMHDGDPRLTPDAVRQANALRERVEAGLKCRIARVPLGNGRRWIQLLAIREEIKQTARQQALAVAKPPEPKP